MAQSTQAERIGDLEAELARLTRDNARLRRLLDERDAPSELRHRQRDSLAMLRSIIGSSAETAQSLEAYVLHLEDRLDAIARAQSIIDVAGKADLGNLVASELLSYTVQEGDQATLSGPRLELRPAAAQVLALAIHELAVNAIEHGQLSPGDGRLDVNWSVTDGPEAPALSLVWKEHGASELAAPARQGFGTTVLTEKLCYELQARTELSYEPDGLRCTITIPFSAQVGLIVEEEI